MSTTQEIFKEISDKNDADIFIFNAGINFKNADRLILTIKSIENKKPNCVLILTTSGGDADAAYRMIRHIHRNYKKLIFYVIGYCKSAGTLMAMGADELIMSDFGELGPLDVQMSKDDELVNTSGLSYLQSLLFLKKQAFDFFEEFFIQLKEHSGYTITTKTASEISATLSVGLLSPISQQLDPLKLGEVQRAISIALQYGHRICRLNKSAIDTFISKYPTHSFVIDYEELKEVMKLDNVRFLERSEEKFELLLREKCRLPAQDPIIECLYSPLQSVSPTATPIIDKTTKSSIKNVKKGIKRSNHTRIGKPNVKSELSNGKFN